MWIRECSSNQNESNQIYDESFDDSEIHFIRFIYDYIYLEKVNQIRILKYSSSDWTGVKQLSMKSKNKLE